MIRVITQRTLTEIFNEMTARGVSIKDTEGFGISTDPSGHYYVVYDDGTKEYIDTSLGSAGVSVYDNTGTTDVLGAAAIGKWHEQATTATLTMSGGAGTATLALSSGYIIPGTVTISDTAGVAPELKDNGKGKIVESGNPGILRGTINYETGALSATYVVNKAPTGATGEVDYYTSQVPDATAIPDKCLITHIVAEFTNTGTKKIAIYEKEIVAYTGSGGQAHPCVPVVYWTGAAVDTAFTGNAWQAHIDVNRVSTCQEFDVDKRGQRWVQWDGDLERIYVYWQRVD